MGLISGDKEKVFAKDDIGRVRMSQEDSHDYRLKTPNGALFVVCDGMGGHVGGAMASRIAVKSIIEYIEKERYDSPKETLNGALQFANMQILGFADSNPEYKGMGTTACVVLITDYDVWIAHVGDSRIYLYLGKERELHRLTKDHSMVQSLVDAGEITEREAERHPNKNRITKALGFSPDLKPTFNYRDRGILPKNRDVFLICSDGLCGMIPDSTIERVLGMKATLKEKGEELIRLAMVGETVQPGGRDNCTVELVEIDKSPIKTTIYKDYNPASSSPSLGKKRVKLVIYAAIAIIGLVFLSLCLHSYNCKQDVKKYSEKARMAREELEIAKKNDYGKKQIDQLIVVYINACRDSTNAANRYNKCLIKF